MCMTTACIIELAIAKEFVLERHTYDMRRTIQNGEELGRR